jgi:hypothetical protein
MDALGHPGPDLDDSCPPWCRRAHAAADHPEDRHHHGAARLVAVVTGDPMLEPDDRAEPASVVARLVRRVGSDQTWVEVVSEEGDDVRLVVTAESARRLVTTVRELLADAAT